MITSQQDVYADILQHSQRANFELDDVLGPEAAFDFARPFLPRALARTDALDFLGGDEKLMLNHIRAHAYLSLFGLVEEFILPFLLDHARTRLDGPDSEVRALLQFANEEAKHIALFRRFRKRFEASFGSPCEIIGPPEAIARAVLAHDPLSVALAILQIEWMTQAHYVDSVRDDAGLDPQFQKLLRCHWMEESQHARLDTLIVEALAAPYSAEARAAALDGYFAIGGFLAEGLAQQVELDLSALERKTGCRLRDADRARFVEVQRAANHYTYLGSGMQHPRFQRTVGGLGGNLLARLQEAAPSFC